MLHPISKIVNIRSIQKAAGKQAGLGALSVHLGVLKKTCDIGTDAGKPKPLDKMDPKLGYLVVDRKVVKRYPSSATYAAWTVCSVANMASGGIGKVADARKLAY